MGILTSLSSLFGLQRHSAQSSPLIPMTMSVNGVPQRHATDQ